MSRSVRMNSGKGTDLFTPNVRFCGGVPTEAAIPRRNAPLSRLILRIGIEIGLEHREASSPPPPTAKAAIQGREHNAKDVNLRNFT